MFIFTEVLACHMHQYLKYIMSTIQFDKLPFYALCAKYLVGVLTLLQKPHSIEIVLHNHKVKDCLQAVLHDGL